MGCDIHAYIDYDAEHKGVLADSVTRGYVKQYHEDGTPIFRAESFVDGLFMRRYYLLFAILADTRNYWEVEQPFPVRGLPSEISWEVREAYHEQDGVTPNSDWHHPSWLTVEELQAVYDRYTTDHARLFPHEKFYATEVPAIIAAMRALNETLVCEGGQSRFVFWFDN